MKQITTTPKKTIIAILCFLVFGFSITSFAQGVWTQKKTSDPAGSTRDGAVAFSVGTKGYLGLGTINAGTTYKNDLWEYDPSTNAWTQKANFTGNARSYAVGFGIGTKGYVGTGKSYVAGPGWTYYNDFYEYNPSTNTWTAKANFGGNPRSNAFCFAVGTKGYIGKGEHPTLSIDDFYEYNPSTNVWTIKANPKAGWPFVNEVGYGLATMGYVTEQQYSTNNFFQYDPSINTWSQKANSSAYNNAGGGFAVNGYCYLALTDGNFYKYDPNTNIWTQKASTSNAKFGFSIGTKGYFAPWALNEFDYTEILTGAVTSATSICAGSTITLSYVVDGNFSSGPNFYLQLSNASGSFASPRDIKQWSATTGGTISAVIPSDIVTGSGYKLRVVTYSPAVTGTTSPSTLYINSIPNNLALSLSPNKSVYCTNENVTILNSAISPTSGTTAGLAYSWAGPSSYSNNTSSASLTALTTAKAGTYTVTVTDNSGTIGCAANTTITVSVNPTPTASISSSANMCTGTGQTLIASSSYSLTYAWSNGPTGSSDYITPTTSVTSTPYTYTLTMTDGQSCTNTTQTTVTVNPLPTINSFTPASSTICSGNSVTLNANTNLGSLYYWYKDGILQGGATTSNTFSASQSGNYTFTVYTSNSCSVNSGSASLTVNPIPTPLIASSNTPLCAGSILSLSTSDGFSYNWSGPAGFNSSSQYPSISNAPTNSAGTYVVTATNGYGCANTASTVVIVNANPIASAGSTAYVCEGGSTTLTATGNGNYIWDDNSTNYTRLVTPSTTTTYTVTVTNVNNCTDVSSVMVSVALNPIAAFTLSGPTTFCEGSNLVLNATTGTGYIYQWIKDGIDISGAQNSSFTVTESGSYSLKVTKGCTSISTNVDVTVNPSPTSAITNSVSNEFCEGNTVTLQANTGSNLSYQWKLDGSNLSSATNDSYVASLGGNYTAVVTNENGCSKTSKQISLTKNMAPRITSQPLNQSVCPNANATYNISATGAGLTFQWQESTDNGGSWNDLLGETSTILSIINVQPAMNNNQYRCVISGTCVPSATSSSALLTVSLTILINDQPKDTSACEAGDAQFSISASGSNLSYQWYYKTALAGAFSILNNNGTYSNTKGATLYITGATQAELDQAEFKCFVTNTCSGSLYSDPALLSFFISPSITGQPIGKNICEGEPVSFGVKAIGNGLTYKWQASNGAGYSDLANGISNGVTFSNVNSDTLKITNTKPSISDYFFRCQIVGSCMPIIYSTPVQLTVKGAPKITSINYNSKICKDASTNFTIIATGNDLTYQWQVDSGNGLKTLSNDGIYSGIDQNKLLISAVQTNMKNYQFTCNLVGSCAPSLTSNPLQISVEELPAITLQPNDTITCLGGNATFTVAASGSELTYQWQVNNGTGWVDISNTGIYSNVNQPTLNITGANANMNNYKHRCVVSGFCIPAATSDMARLQVITAMADAGQDISICRGSNGSLLATGGTTYKWSPSTGLNNTDIANPIANPNSTISYTVTVTNANGCSASDKILVAVNDIPFAAITPLGATTICQQQSSTLNATTGTDLTYQWKKDGINISGANTSLYQATQSGDYSVVITNGYNCPSTSAPTTITVNSIPVATITPTSATTFCSGDSVILNANDELGLSYQWQKNTANINLQNANSYVAKSSGNYKVIVTDANNCSNTSLAEVVTSNTLPNANITTIGKTNICEGNSVQLLVGTGSGYIYQWQKNNSDISGATSSSFITTDGGKFSVVVTDPNNCSNISTEKTITVNPLPVANAGTDIGITNGSKAILNGQASGGTGILTFAWTPVEFISSSTNTSSATTKNLTTSSVFTLNVTDSAGCIASDNITVLVSGGALDVSSSASNTTICSGNTITLYGQASGGTGNYSYTWYSTPAGFNSTQATPSVSPLTNTTYTFVVDDEYYKDSIDIAITVNAMPNITITPQSALSFCSGNSVQLDAPTGSGYTYQWYKDANTIAGGNASSIVATTSGDYTVDISSAGSCTVKSLPVTVIAHALPIAIATFIGNTSICQGDSIKLNANAISGLKYQWQKNNSVLLNDTLVNLYAKETGNYRIATTDTNGCTNVSSSISLTVNNLTDASITTIGDTIFCSGGSSILTVNAGNGALYQWKKNNININGATISSFIAKQSGNYAIEIIDQNNCTIVSPAKTIVVKSLPVVNAGVDKSIPNGSTTTITGTASSAENIASQAWTPKAFIKSGADSITASTKHLTTSTVFTFTATDSAGCKNSDWMSVTVTGGPLSVDISSGSNSICLGGSTSLMAMPTGGSGKYTYSWSSLPIGFSDTAVSPIVTPTTTTTFTVQVDDGFYNQSATIVISVDSAYTAIINPAGLTTFCQGNKVLLNTNSGNGYTYQWYKDGLLINGASASAYNADVSGNYQVEISNTSGCAVRSSKQLVTVKPSPLSYITTTDELTFCQGNAISLNANTGNGLSYQWKKNNIEITNEKDSALTVNTSGNYTVVITNSDGCVKTSTPLSINVHALPNAIITALGDTTFCAGSTVLLSTNTANGYTYQWNKNNSDLANEINSTLNVSDSGSYKVIVTDINNCIATALPIKTTVVANPDATITTLGKTTMCLGDTVTLSVEDNNNYNYNWKFNGIDLTKEISNSLIITKAGQYSVYIANALTGCASQSTKTNVIVNALPAPTLSSSNAIYACINDTTILSVTNSFSAHSWSNNQTVSTIKVYTAGTYAATVTDSKGCKASAEIIITEQTQAAPEICMVSVSELQDYKNNIVTWNHKQGVNIDHFNVYKMDQFSNVYLKIGEVPAAQDGIFSDLASTPAKRSEFYKLSMVDICAKETPLSVNHKTMHLMRVPGTDTTIINLIWENYEGLDFNSYTIFRGPDIYHMDTLDYVTNLITSYSDLQLPTYRPIYYNVGINLKSICVNDTKAKATEKGPYTMSRSNVEDAGVIDDVGIDDIAGVNGKFSIYPNPVRDELIVKDNVTSSSAAYRDARKLIITNSLGQVVLSTRLLANSSTIKLNIQNLANGMYYLRINGVVKKFVVNK